MMRMKVEVKRRADRTFFIWSWVDKLKLMSPAAPISPTPVYITLKPCMYVKDNI